MAARDILVSTDTMRLDDSVAVPMNIPNIKTEPTKRGRPTKIFDECSTRTKKRRVAQLIENYSLEDLEFAIKKKKNI